MMPRIGQGTRRESWSTDVTHHLQNPGYRKSNLGTSEAKGEPVVGFRSKAREN